MYPKLPIGFAPAASHALTLIKKTLLLKLDYHPLESIKKVLLSLSDGFPWSEPRSEHFIAPMIIANRETLSFPRRLPRGQTND